MLFTPFIDVVRSLTLVEVLAVAILTPFAIRYGHILLCWSFNRFLDATRRPETKRQIGGSCCAHIAKACFEEADRIELEVSEVTEKLFVSYRDVMEANNRSRTQEEAALELTRARASAEDLVQLRKDLVLEYGLWQGVGVAYNKAAERISNGKASTTSSGKEINSLVRALIRSAEEIYKHPLDAAREYISQGYVSAIPVNTDKFEIEPQIVRKISAVTETKENVA